MQQRINVAKPKKDVSGIYMKNLSAIRVIFGVEALHQGHPTTLNRLEGINFHGGGEREGAGAHFRP
jgi:hypothetical protein